MDLGDAAGSIKQPDVNRAHGVARWMVTSVFGGLEEIRAQEHPLECLGS